MNPKHDHQSHHDEEQHPRRRRSHERRHEDPQPPEYARDDASCEGDCPREEGREHGQEGHRGDPRPQRSGRPMHGPDERHHGHRHHGGGRPEPPGGRMNRFLQPRLLLVIARKERSYGYELIESVGQGGFEPGALDPGAIYRNLRGMESEGLVTSEWDTEGTGPAKRQYRLTPEGEEMLHSWVAGIRQRKAALEQFLDEYDAYRAAKAAPDSQDDAPEDH